jgi:hypothetical protein
MKVGSKQSHLTFMLVSCWAYSLTLTMDATFSSEMSVDLRQAAQYYVPEDGTLQVFFFLLLSSHSQLWAEESVYITC